MPLAVLVFILGAWVALRAATWNASLDVPGLAVAGPVELFQTGGEGAEALAAIDRASLSGPAPQSIAYAPMLAYPPYRLAYDDGYRAGMEYSARLEAEYRSGIRAYGQATGRGFASDRRRAGPAQFNREAFAYSRANPWPGQERRSNIAGDFGSGHQHLMQQAFAVDWHTQGALRGGNSIDRKRRFKEAQPLRAATPPYAAQPLPVVQPSADRWALDVFGFYRQGSSALSITQGRRPIYGASQLGAKLHWRARPSSSHDPRLFARAYHALVTGGESELALGASARPLGSVPVRAFGELRVTRNPGVSEDAVAPQTRLRPAAYAATEIPPVRLPLGLSLEAYAAGGYVGGAQGTLFADGQSVLTRQLTRIGNPNSSSAAVSVGAGVWGGAQKGVHRVDVGPTLRFDVNIGDVPARLSVDYREQVAGDADPDSGVAATVSTRF